MAPGSFDFLPVPSPFISGLRIVPTPGAHPRTTNPIASSYSCLLILKACHGPRPQPLHIPSCFATTFTQLRTGKNPLFCHLTVRTAFSALRVGVSSQEKNTLIILFMLRIASERCTRLVGWADVPTRRLGTSPAENSSPLDEGDVIFVCE